AEPKISRKKFSASRISFRYVEPDPKGSGSTCPSQRNLPLLTTSTTHSIPKRERKYPLLFLSDNFIPHILLIIHISLRSSLLASSSFKGQVSLLYTKTLCTQAL